MTLPDTGFEYTGRDNLAAMLSAVRYNAHLLDLVLGHARPGERILDFGAGLGNFAKSVSDRGFEVTCLEVDDGFRASLRARDLPALGSIHELPDRSFDYIYALNVLEHIEDDRDALHRLRGKLRPDGRLFLYVPAFPVLYSTMDALVGHHRRYTGPSLAAALRDAGFRVLHWRYADSLGFLAALAYRIVGGSGRLSPASIKIYDQWLFPVSRAIDPIAGRVFGKNVHALAVPD